MSLAIRIADHADVGSIAGLLRERDGAAHPTTAVARYLADLDPSRITVWLAEKEGQPVGINAVYRRKIRSPAGCLEAGYWSHLYVRPEARALMVYPQLVMAMLRWAQAGGADLIYTATRQEHVAAAHLKLGFVKIMTQPVLLRPLRPGRLLASRSRAVRQWAGWAVPLVDAAVSAGRAAVGLPGRTAAMREVRADDHAAAELAALQLGLEGYIRTAWTASDWLDRFSTAIEGHEYQASVAPRRGEAEAGVLIRIAERGSPAVRIGVVLDLVDRSPGRKHLASLLRWAERQAIKAGADAIIALPMVAEAERRPYRARGYWTAPETYTLLYRSTSSRCRAEQMQNPEAWRFCFAEHDAF